jgi:hypothetical protein
MFFTFDRQTDFRADSRARANTGNTIAARIPMIAITTSSSISVNALDFLIMVAAIPPHAIIIVDEPPNNDRRR